MCVRLSKNHDCDLCSDMLVSKCRSKQDLPIFLKFKLYDHCSVNSLATPSHLIFTVLQKCQTVFDDTFEQSKQKQGILGRLFSSSVGEARKISEVADYSDCRADTIQKVIGLFLRVLLYHNIKLLNRSLLQNAGSRKNRKVQKVMHTLHNWHMFPEHYDFDYVLVIRNTTVVVWF